MHIIMNVIIEAVLMDLLKQNPLEPCSFDQCIYCGHGEKPRV